MKLQYVDRSNPLNCALAFNTHNFPYFFKVWHYHDELELVLINKGIGTYFIGDEINSFKPGDLFLIGSNVPHMLLSDKEYFEENSTLSIEALVIHFDKKIIEGDIFNLLEAQNIKAFLSATKRAIKVGEKTALKVENLMLQMQKMSDFEKVLMLLKILEVISLGNAYSVISSIGFSEVYGTPQNKRMDKVYNFIFTNFKNNIALDQLVEISNMNKSSFCRYFKKINGKTVSRYVNEIRIGYACKLLQSGKLSISEICYDSGFNNISNFNRQFRNLKNMSPTEYLNKYN